ncbi:MAG: hypothetical protein ACR2J4_09230, partial [Deinococcus sp.]
INATVQGWKGGAGTVEAYTYTLAGGKVKVASTDLSSAGVFSMTLPGKDTLQPVMNTLIELFGPGQDTTCAALPVSSDAALKVATIDRFTVLRGGAQVSTLLTSPPATASTTLPFNLDAYVYFYADRSSTVTGTQDCTYAPGSGSTSHSTSTFNMKLKAGWNVVHITGKLDGSATAYTNTADFSTTDKTDFSWYATATGGPSPASLPLYR